MPQDITKKALEKRTEEEVRIYEKCGMSFPGELRKNYDGAFYVHEEINGIDAGMMELKDGMRIRIVISGPKFRNYFRDYIFRG